MLSSNLKAILGVSIFSLALGAISLALMPDPPSPYRRLVFDWSRITGFRFTPPSCAGPKTPRAPAPPPKGPAASGCGP